MFTQEQKDFFETFGFLFFKNYFSPVEMEEITGVFDRIVAEERQGGDFSGEKRQSIYAFVENHPSLVRLLEDDRIYEPMAQILGENFTWLISEAQLYVGDTEWHPDNSNHYRYIKFGLYLDPVRKDTGCLRVIPGSHHEPVHSLLKQTVRGKEKAVQQEIPCFPLESDPGDVIMFDMRVWHASFGGHTGRRMIALNFAEYPASPEQIDAYKENYRGVLRLMKDFQYSQTNQVFSDAFLHSDKPRTRAMASKLVELDLK